MTRWVQALTFCLTLLGPAMRPAKGSPADGDTDKLPQPTLCAVEVACNQPAPLALLPQLSCSLCLAQQALAAGVAHAQATVCSALSILPLMPNVVDCAVPQLRQAASHTTAHM
jgi:hypothetical protein